jgi:bis(5'-nucleosyl)-tetraphosphatase (symmetrical)
MPVYAIGDLQGCYTELQDLLTRLDFNPASDRLWFVGDLVNRGPQSLECLRFVKSLGDSAMTVLGNHDLSLLSTMAGVRKLGERDTIADILNAKDRTELFDWLRRQPLLHHDPELNYVLLHAGLPPQWDLAQAKICAREIETLLRGRNYKKFFEGMYGDMPANWSEALSGAERWRFMTNCFTRLRYCTQDGKLDLKHKDTPGTQKRGLYPWFQVPGRRSRSERILFGHWSTLGCVQEENVISLDTGCVWGGALTAVRLDGKKPEFVSVKCKINHKSHDD